ncbi:MAG TPA: NADH-quinone oxidoreductase subunit G [Jatrophihabitans sp.]|jgi:NADH-quinone oxidoreductase subunit G
MTAVDNKEDLVTVTIDGFEISVPKGTLLIRAAEQLGISIPRFCDHPLLDPAGACRQCLVEVTDTGNGRGMPKPAASCTTTVMPGMVVKTQLTSVVADKAQQGVMELLLINHPLDCPVCDKGGECPLQNQAMSNGRADSRFLEKKRTFPKPVAISSNVLLDRERCVLCQRCTRFSEQIAGDPFIDLLERGAQQQIGTSEEEPFQSYFSGNTVQICPVGALTGASYRFRARPFDLRSTDSVCEHCSSGCAMRIDWRRSKVTRRLAGEDPEVNEEWNCDKGRWAFHYAEQADRLLTPLVRNKNGQLVEASWPEALETAARGLREAAGKVAVLPGGRLTEEDAYAYSKFARLALGTNDIDFRARPLSDEETSFLGEHVAGVTPQHVSYATLEKAPAVLLAGFEPEEESPIVFLRLRTGVRKHGTKVVAVAPLLSQGAKKLDAMLLPTVPGAEADVLGALDTEVTSALEQSGAVILVGERLATSPGALTAAVDLAKRTGASLAWVPRRAGEVGAVSVGALPLPAFGVDAPGRNAEQILRAAVVPEDVEVEEGEEVLTPEIEALLVGGVDPADFADPAQAYAALAAASFVVSLEIRRSAVTEHADVVLPVAPPAEKAGRYVTWEGRRRPFDLTLTGTGALTDAQVLDALADELDVTLGLRTVGQARTELASFTFGGQPSYTSLDRQNRTEPGAGEAVLATWHELLDAGRAQDGDEYLAGTAKPPRAVMSAATAGEHGLSGGDAITISTDAGSLTLPIELGAVPDRVVWLPTNARDCAVRATLRAVNGTIVKLSGGDVA